MPIYRDPYFTMPNDQTKLRYWILDEEQLKLVSMQELEVALEEPVDMTAEQYLAITSSGGMFSEDADVGGFLDGGIYRAHVRVIGSLLIYPSMGPNGTL